jgi:hypothetical protein
MTTRPKKKKKKAAKKAARKLAPKKNAPKKNAAKAKSRKAAKTRGTKSARPRASAPKVAPTSKRVAQRRLALLSVSGRRAKSLPNRGPARGRVTARPRISKLMPGAPRVPGVSIKGHLGRRHFEVLTPAALRFLAALHRQFTGARERMSASHETSPTEAAAVPELMTREQPSDAALTILDFADERFARWSDRLEGQIGLKDRASSSTSVVCPRDWDVVEECLLIDGTPMAAALFDFGLCVFHARNAEQRTRVGFCLPTLETSDGASLWREILFFAQDQLGMQSNAIVAKARIEDVLAELRPSPG